MSNLVKLTIKGKNYELKKSSLMALSVVTKFFNGLMPNSNIFLTKDNYMALSDSLERCGLPFEVYNIDTLDELSPSDIANLFEAMQAKLKSDGVIDSETITVDSKVLQDNGKLLETKEALEREIEELQAKKARL